MNRKEDLYLEIKEVLYSINYIYYGLYFLVFAGLQVFHVLLLSFSSTLSRVMYVFYAGGEAFIEVLFLAFITSWLVKHQKRKLYYCFTMITVLLLVSRIIDFFLVRLLDFSIWYGVGLIFDGSTPSFTELLHASNIPLSIWFLGGGSVLAFAFFVLLLAVLSEKVCKRWSLSFSMKRFFGFFVLGCSLLVLSESFLFFEIERKHALEYAKALPWKTTLLPSQETTLTVGCNLKPMPSGPILFEGADSNLFALERKPDVFLFIAESLREDFLTEETTPALASFARENRQFPQALSVANATHISWFSTFYSLYPFYWDQYQTKKWQLGSHSLSLLKKMGYQIHVYSSSRLNFYEMNQVILGKDMYLADEVKEFREDPNTESCEADKRAIEHLCQKIKSSDQKGGRIFVVFLDSTHFDYSWPREQEPVFTPIEDSVNYLKLSYDREDLTKLTNRYKNSLYYVDQLFHVFASSLQEKGLWEDSVVIFTGDHAESFNEDGHIFHASALSRAQLKVPLYMKLGKEGTRFSQDTSGSASQIDIFPTLFHYLLGEPIPKSSLHGKSLLMQDRPAYTIGGRYNGGRAPYQFYIQSGEYRAIFEFCNRNDIFDCNTLKVCSIEDAQGEEIPFSLSFIHMHFQEALDELFALHDK